jgi:hypothetical protein
MAATRQVIHVGFDAPVLINAADFDPAVHQEMVAPVAADPAAVPEPSDGEAVAVATPKPAKGKGKK